jgi:hypothetical protein
MESKKKKTRKLRSEKETYKGKRENGEKWANKAMETEWRDGIVRKRERKNDNKQQYYAAYLAKVSNIKFYETLFGFTDCLI